MRAGLLFVGFFLVVATRTLAQPPAIILPEQFVDHSAAHLPLAEKLTRLHQPEVRAAILSESASATDDPLFFRPNYDKMYLLGNPPDYEQPKENALGPQASRLGRKPEELAYDAMLSDEGRGMLYVPFLNYADGNLDAIAAEALQALIASACRLYRARREAGEEFAPVPKNSISATDVMVTASGLLKATDLAVFELGMWQNWTGR